MELSETLENAKDFFMSPTGKVVGGIALVGGVVYLVNKSRQASVETPTQSQTSAIRATNSGDNTGSGVSAGLSQEALLRAQAETQTALVKAQTDQQLSLLSAQSSAARENALFQLELNQRGAELAIQNQTNQFDAQYGGLDSGILEYAGVGSFSPSGAALSTTNSPRTRPVPVSGSGLESGVPSQAGQSVLEAIAQSLGLGIANGESRASVLARLQESQNAKLIQNQITLQNAADASYNQRLEAMTNSQRLLNDQQYQNQYNLQNEQLKQQDRANNPFSSIGNFLKTAGSIGASIFGGRSQSAPKNQSIPISQPEGDAVMSIPINPGSLSIPSPSLIPPSQSNTNQGLPVLAQPAYVQQQQYGGVLPFLELPSGG